MSSASKLTVVRFVPAHFEEIELQDAQAYVRDVMTPEKLEELATCGPSFSAFVGDRLICCGGLREYDADRGVLWAFVSPQAGRHFVSIHRCAQRLIDIVDRPHIQATCRAGFKAGARWLSMLGFTWSRPLGEYGPGRVHYDLFERVRA